MMKFIETKSKDFYLKSFIQISVLWISYRAMLDMQEFMSISTRWKLIGLLLIAIMILANGLLFFGIFTRFGVHFRQWFWGLPKIIKMFLALFLNLIPGYFLIFIEYGDYFSGPYLRFVMYLGVSVFTTLLFAEIKNKWRAAQVLLICFGAAAFILTIYANASGVKTTPFSLSWSEGNRFYDYSLTFGKDLYTYSGDLRVPYNTPGRYALWGSLFLIPELPIWVHRLWNAALWVFSPLLLTWLLSRKISNPLLRWGVTLWGALFIMQGPVYPHLVVPMILLAIVIWSDKFWIKVIGGAIISYYAGISRFTWAVLPGVWLVLQDLIHSYPSRPGRWHRKLYPTIILGLAGILPGVIGSWGNVITPGQSFATTQPLLFYRLFPNATYGSGVLLGAFLISLPLIVFLGWLIRTKKWQVEGLARVAMIVSLSGFLVLGLVASIKIGGGSNLHNLDMFILTLVFLTILAISNMQEKFGTQKIHIPDWVIACLFVAMVIPGWISYRNGHPIITNKPSVEHNALDTIKNEVITAKQQGEVLFIDQRQLLTFGYIKDVPLVAEYEKKYMMDQAMGNNQQYFDPF